MAHAATLRATSFAASAGLLAVIAVGAMTMTFTNHMPSFPEAEGVIEVVTEPPPPPATPPTTTRELPPESLVTADAQSLNPPPADTSQPQQETAIAFVGPAGPPTITDPHWLRRPTDLARYYPRRALEAGVGGSVLLDCDVSVTGTLDCVVVSETPPDWGFAAAALRISRQHQMVPARRDGVAVEGRYRMRVPFQLR